MKTMSDNDLIRRGDVYDEILAALNKLDAVYNSGEITDEAYDVMWNAVEGLIDQVDTVPQDRAKGKWIDKFNKGASHMQSFCSACGKHSGIGGIESNRHKPFCPNCGADMREEKSYAKQ